MKQIHKGREPEALQRHRRMADAGFDNLSRDAKQAIREQLLGDQGFLCCYCTRRIASEGSRIEHFKCQSDPRYEHQQLDWWNLLLACDGHVDHGRGQHTCDVAKMDRDLSIDPLTPVEVRIRYDRDGHLRCEPQEEIDEVLGLNRPHLRRQRQRAIDGLIDAMQRRKSGKWSPRRLERERDRILDHSNGRFVPFCTVIAHWLDKRARRERTAAK